MVKGLQVTEEELIREDERLGRLFRQTITKRKHLKINQSQFQSRVLDLFDAIFRSGVSNKAHLTLILKRSPNILNKFCISSQGANINGERILQNLHQVISAHVDDLPRHYEAVDTLVKTIFNIFVYKKPKDYVQILLRIILTLLKSQNSKLVKIVEQNLGILVGFLDKGKDIEKVFFTFRKILGHSFHCLLTRFDELLGLLEHTKNNLFVEQFLKFLFETFHSKLLTQKESQNGQSDAVKSKGQSSSDQLSLARFSSLFEAHCVSVYMGITSREKKSEAEDLKKTAKSRVYLEKLIEYLKGHTEGIPIGNMSKVLGLLKADRKSRESQA